MISDTIGNVMWPGRVLPVCMLVLSMLVASQARAEPPLVADVIRIQRVADSETLSLTGEIIARDVVGVSFPMGGRILSVSVREGDRVTKGQELARLESVQQEQALLGVEAALDAANADLRQAMDEFKRQDIFLERGATTRTRRDDAERFFRISEANVERATAELKRVQKAYDDTILRATAEGVVIDRFADSGEVLAAARPVLALALGGALDAVFDVPEVMPTKIPADLVVQLSLVDRPDVKFTGYVRKISPLVDPKSGTVEVSIGVDQPPASVGYGDAVRVMVARPVPPRITIPYSALTAYGDASAVWVVDPETHAVALSPITISRYHDGLIVVAAGLENGELVVTTSVQLLYPGRILQLKEAK
ncbi:efflux RND transporter periplasmic adaptor subunit [Profundibacter sp.]